MGHTTPAPAHGLWYQQPNSGMSQPIFGGDRFDCGSGRALLAAGLITGSYGTTPDPTAQASGAWANEAIEPVADLAAKQEEAAEHGVSTSAVC